MVFERQTYTDFLYLGVVEMTFYHQEVLRIRKQEFSRFFVAEQLTKARKYMDEHLGDDIDVGTISGVSFLSKYHFIRLFKRYYGVTPHNYLTEKRIGQAREFLRSGLSVMETCFSLGFASPTTFSATFKRYTGFCPTDYKKQFLIRLPLEE